MYGYIIILAILLTTTCSQKLDWNEIKSGHIFRAVSTSILQNISSNHKRERRMLNGEVVHNLENYPYQVGLLLTNKMWCGGSIISDTWILTAAHCLLDQENVIVYFGDINIIQPAPTEKRIFVEANNFVIHKEYNPNYTNDIALIKLNTPIQFSNVIKPIELISLKDADKINDKIVTISGWGKTSDEDTSITVILHAAKVSILPNNQCQSLFHSFNKPLSSTNTETLICANNKLNTGVCEGDSGGAVVAQLNDKPTQIGINSFMVYKLDEDGNIYSRCEEVYVRMFTRLSSHLDWICQETGIC